MEQKTKNNNLKEIEVKGYELVKVDDHNYTLTVANDVENIDINATAEDSKASVTGTGNHELIVGDNDILIIISSESGIENKINVKVTRKDAYDLDDLKSLLENGKKDINISVKADSIIEKKYLGYSWYRSHIFRIA